MINPKDVQFHLFNPTFYTFWIRLTSISAPNIYFPSFFIKIPSTICIKSIIFSLFFHANRSHVSAIFINKHHDELVMGIMRFNLKYLTQDDFFNPSQIFFLVPV